MLLTTAFLTEPFYLPSPEKDRLVFGLLQITHKAVFRLKQIHIAPDDFAVTESFFDLAHNKPQVVFFKSRCRLALEILKFADCHGVLYPCPLSDHCQVSLTCGSCRITDSGAAIHLIIEHKDR